MIPIFSEIRSHERRAVVGAFITLLGIMTAHGMLETARDALFLAKLPPERLPFVYLAIAGIALFANRAHEKVLGRLERQTALRVSLLVTGIGTLSFVWILRGNNHAGLYALYAWSGVATMLVVTRFWIQLEDQFTATQAKRLFAPIGAGSVIGAIFGAGLARIITGVASTETLLPFSALAFALSAVGSYLCQRPGSENAPTRRSSTGANLALILRQPYIRRLLALVTLSTLTFTLSDFFFKYMAARRLPPEELGQFFSMTYLGFNLLSLLLQVGAVTALVRKLGVHRVVAMPALMLGSAAAAAMLIGVMAPVFVLGGAVLLKTVDGSLRHSIHRTSQEMLFVPLSRDLRHRSKAIIDVLGQRGGQALASLCILVLVLSPWPREALLGAIILLAIAWFALAKDLRQHYLNLFRDTLRHGGFEARVDFPSLDMASLETLISTMNSPDDGRVLAALDMLNEQGRGHLIPALILYHPSKEVAIRALDIFAQLGRKDVGPVAERLLQHEDPEVRAAVVRTMSTIDPQTSVPMQEFLDDESAVVRATALVGLVSSGWIAGDAAAKAVAGFTRTAETDEQRALAVAIAQQPSPVFVDELLHLSASTDLEVRRETLHAMRAIGDPRFLLSLLSHLATRELRNEAREALLEIDPPPLDFLSTALADPETPIEVRRHLPRTIHRFDADLAAPVLLQHLVTDQDGITRYKILRALGGLRRHNPHLQLDQKTLRIATEATLTGAFRLVDWRLQLTAGAIADERRRTPVHELLVETMQHKEQHAIERLFRLLGLLYPREDLHRIHDGLRSGNPIAQSSSLELLAATLGSSMREPVLALLGDQSDAERLSLGGRFHERRASDYVQFLSELLGTGGLAMRCLAAYHIGELGLVALRPELTKYVDDPSNFMREVAHRALDLLLAAKESTGNE